MAQFERFPAWSIQLPPELRTTNAQFGQALDVIRDGANSALVVRSFTFGAPGMMMGTTLAQSGGFWFVFYPVLGQLGFLAFMIAGVAAENRTPFDILEAESELVAGFRVEYSGMKFGMIQLGEYAHVLGTSFLGALLFLGAWSGPGPEWLGPVWFFLKAMSMFLLFTWVRWSFVRIKVDQILAVSWKLMLPLTLMLVVATAVVVVLRSGASV